MSIEPTLLPIGDEHLRLPVLSSGLGEDWEGTPPDTDTELFIRKTFEQTPRKGLELLFRHYYRSLCSHSVRLVLCADIAQDIVSDIFYVFWQKHLYTQITSSYRAYLYTAVRHRSLKYLTRELVRDRQTVDVDTTLTLTDQVSPADMLQYNELSAKIETVINALPPRCQKVFLLSRVENKSYADIAQELQISQKMVEAHISKALALLRQSLKDRY